jgi:predicted nuclease with RNAse H fold
MDDRCVIGVDLAGVEHRPTGMCVLRGMQARTFLSGGDDEIIAVVLEEEPALVAIDAPLSLPPGRKTIEDRSGTHFRPSDMALRRRKIPFFPITLGPMRLLTVRGMRLRDVLRDKGFRCIEIYPGGAQDIWGIPRAKKGLAGLRSGLEERGLTGLGAEISDHELDAATGALVARLFLQNRAEVYGRFESGAIIMPIPD